MAKVIKLAGQEINVVAPAFGKLRKVISSINKIQQFSSNQSGISEESLVEVSLILSIMTGKTIEEIDSMPIGIDEMSKAMEIIPEICGLEVAKSSGEVQA